MTNPTLQLDFNLSTAEQIGGGGLQRADLEALAPVVAQAHQALTQGRREGRIAFMDLPGQTAAIDEAVALGRELGAQFENLVVLGIGGSSLGPKALYKALKHPFVSLLPASQRGGARLFFPDNSDPSTFAGLLEVLDLKRTAFAAITKSGGTAETWAQLLHVSSQLDATARQKQIVAVTDPKVGALRAVATKEGWRTLPVPPAVGGRFSVLTPVGLLPAAAAGIDVAALLKGAANMAKRCEATTLFENPAYMLASVLHWFHTQHARPIHVLMPYVDALRETGDWFVQLWGESLGKKKGREHVGPTPVRAVGATDQHSLLQLLMEGPQDKVVVFVTAETPREELTIPHGFSDQPDVAYLGGHRFSKLLNTEQYATSVALAANGRPSITIRLQKLDAFAMGELMMLWEVATAFSGPLYGINPYDQPGVEAGKRYTCGLLGRPGYEGAKAELEARPALKRDWLL
ncbi:MAG: glucose-6-phosphate isomerase [Myxococcaceae bacterium]|nr:glucose-6-phosphate isomerase [Myxococcaceae bacterium]